MKIIKNNSKIIFLIVTGLFFFSFFVSSLFAGEKSKVLVINSNASVEKYKIVQDEFKKEMAHLSVQAINLNDNRFNMRELISYDPELIYCIGTKAYFFAARYFEERPIIFSSIINWLRLPLSRKTYGVSNELHTRMPMMMFRYIFSDIKKIGVLYSSQYTSEWFEKANEQARELEIELVGRMVSDENEAVFALKKLFSGIHAFWLIPDPLVTPKKESLFQILKLCDSKKIPVFSYLEAYAEIGATLIISVDNPTIGRQAAGIATQVLSNESISERVQFPAGSHITLNMKKVKEYDLKYNSDALGMINNIIK